MKPRPLSDLPAAFITRNAVTLKDVLPAKWKPHPTAILAPLRPGKPRPLAKTAIAPRKAATVAAFAKCCNVAPFPEFRFHPERKWRFDLAWPHVMLAVEIDGGLFINGGHSRGAARERDYEKDAHALIAGWRVLRVSTGQMRSGKAAEWAKAILAPKPLQPWPPQRVWAGHLGGPDE